MNLPEQNKAGTLPDSDLVKEVSRCKYTLLSDRQAVKHLKELHLQEQKRKYDLPYYSCPDYSATTTNGLTKCVLAFLKLKGHFCERTGNEGRTIDKRQTVTDILGNLRTIGSVQRVRSSGMKGTSDLKAIIQGRFIAIEIKNALTHDKLRPEQKHYQTEIEGSGGLYVVVTSFYQWCNYYYSTWEANTEKDPVR
jgi:hypothetical protein